MGSEMCIRDRVHAAPADPQGLSGPVTNRAFCEQAAYLIAGMDWASPPAPTTAGKRTFFLAGLALLYCGSGPCPRSDCGFSISQDHSAPRQTPGHFIERSPRMGTRKNSSLLRCLPARSSFFTARSSPARPGAHWNSEPVQHWYGLTLRRNRAQETCGLYKLCAE